MEILLVEDDLDDAKDTIDVLNRGNVRCRVSLVRDGEEARRFLHREGVFARTPRPDLVLLDVQLPKRDGHQFLSEMRADEDLDKIPVLVLSGSAIYKSLFEGEGLHVDAFFAKPLEPEPFVRLVKTLHYSLLTELVASATA